MNHPLQVMIAIVLAGSLLCSTTVRGQAPDPSYLREMPAPERILNEIKGKDPQDTIERQMGAFMALNKIIDDMAQGLEKRYLPTRAKPDEIRIKDMYGHAYAALWHKAVRKEEHKYDHDWDLFDELMAKFFSQSFKDLYFQSSKNSQAQYKAYREKNSGVVFGAPSEKAKKDEIHKLCAAKGLDDFTCMLQSVVKEAIKGIDSLKAPVKPGLILSGVYVTKNFSVFLMPQLSTWVSCGDVFLSTEYAIELKGDQVFVNIQNGKDSFALRMQPDGSSLTGSGTVPIHGYTASGGGSSSSGTTAVSSTEVTTTRQRELTPLEANQYQNAVKNGQTYTINETTTSTEYTTTMTPATSGGLTFRGKTEPCRVGVLALKRQMVAPGDPKPMEGLRMIGAYLGDGGANIEFSPEKAIVGCGQTIVERSYDLSLRGGQVFINIPGNGGAQSFTFRPDGILAGTGATVTLNGKRKTGEDRLGDTTYVQSSDTCTYGILAPPGKSRRSGTAASNTTAPAAARDTPGPTGTTTSVGPPVLTVTNGFLGQVANPLSGRELLLLKASFEDALRKAGFQDPASAAVKRSAVAIWAAACKSRTPMCKQGIDALQSFYAGKVRLDQSGTASISGMPPGSFWILGLGTANGQHFVWNLPIDIKPGSNSITFDPRNATIIY